jgi:hypothetical protein
MVYESELEMMLNEEGVSRHFAGAIDEIRKKPQSS